MADTVSLPLPDHGEDIHNVFTFFFQSDDNLVRPGQLIDVQFVRTRAEDADALDTLEDLDLLFFPEIRLDLKHFLTRLLGNLVDGLLLQNVVVPFGLTDVEKLLPAATRAPFQYLRRTVFELSDRKSVV